MKNLLTNFKDINLKLNVKKTITIFFATDDNYVPFLAVSLRSIIDNASKDYNYQIYILITKLSNENMDNLKAMSNKNFKINFVDVNKKLNNVGGELHLRDYYSKAIYYRLFIASLFPKINKAIYLDCDIVVNQDISKLYNHDLKDNLLGAVTEEVMVTVDTFGRYAEEALGVDRQNYFNSGILLMNLKEYRKQKIEAKFNDMLNKYKFIVAPDQDYLNVLCKDKVLYLNAGWNKTPIEMSGFDIKDLSLIHYKMAWKPWQYDNVMYGDYFWEYAKKTSFIDKIVEIKNNYKEDKILRDKLSYEKLLNTALTDINDPNNYKRSIEKENTFDTDNFTIDAMNNITGFVESIIEKQTI